MAGSESVQKVLTRVRPPRVKITYDVEIGNAIEKKELPFIVGILASLSGENAPSLPPLKERKFVEIDRDNFDAVLKAARPQVTVKVNTPGADGNRVEHGCPLTFTSYEDFRPEKLVENIPQLKALLEKRNALRDLLTKSDGNDKWAKLINDAVSSNAAVLKALAPPSGSNGSLITEEKPNTQDPEAPHVEASDAEKPNSETANETKPEVNGEEKPAT